MQREQQRDIERNRQELGEHYETLSWIGTQQAREAEEERCRLLDGLAARGVGSTAKGAKLFARALSPGCSTCVAGNWSCLFVNNICNGRCFYCPTPQVSEDEPSTNALTFREAADYADYLEFFGFQGASVSGGEPLLTFDRTLAFLRAARERCGEAVHLWMYTNGLLLTADKLRLLKEAGLAEIRFDISADRYSLDKVALAVGVIDSVTVEIPAIPEDFELLREKMRELDRLGAGFLNLHQLRCTPHNRKNLVGRPYTYLHGPKVTVLESELCALRLLDCALAEGLGLAVNYCSFIYKHRYQGAAARRRAAGLISKPWETITETGHLKSREVSGPPGVLASLAEGLKGHRGWELNRTGDRLLLSEELLGVLLPAELKTETVYHAAALRERVSYRNLFKEVRLAGGRKIAVERWPLAVEGEPEVGGRQTEREEIGAGLLPYY